MNVKLKMFLIKYPLKFILSVVVLAVIFGYAFGIYLSSFSEEKVTQINSTLFSCKGNLALVNQNLSDCSSSLSKKKIERESCSLNLNSLQTTFSQLQSNSTQLSNALFNCQNQSSTFSVLLDKRNQEYASVVKSYAKSFCCSLGDISNGNARNWTLTGSEIVCSGNVTINCSTGSVGP